MGKKLNSQVFFFLIIIIVWGKGGGFHIRYLFADPESVLKVATEFNLC
jgi:hypothetical protein